MNKDSYYIKISIITVTYNCAETIARTIESVVNQNYCRYEYIVVDGVSDDGTREIIENYLDDIDYYISEKDTGIYNAMNKALRFASGELILFLNGDDYLVDEDVLCQVAKYYIDDETILIGRVLFGDKISSVINKQINSKYYGIFYPHQATFVPENLYRKIGGFDEHYSISGDFEWLCRAIYNGYPIIWVDEIISVYSLGGKSASLQRCIDEYNISNKYMLLSNDGHIDDMREMYKEAATNIFLEMVCSESNYISQCRELLQQEAIIDEKTVQVWGAGYWGNLFLKLLLKCGANVDYIFDSKKKEEHSEGIPIIPFNKIYVTKVIIATDVYDEEITEFLNGQGLVSKRDYISFHELKKLLLKAFNKKSKVYKDFLAQTEFDVLA